MFEEVKNTFKILEDQGINYDFLYKNAERENSFDISLQSICDKLQIKIIYDNNLTNEKKEKISGYSDFNDKKIYINDSEVGTRMRFTLGHELYHILNKQNENRDEKNKFTENELFANAFAAELLMPEEFLIKKIANCGLDVQKLSVYFRVSVPAMFYRLTNLGYLLK